MNDIKPKPITQEVDDTPKLLMLSDYEESVPLGGGTCKFLEGRSYRVSSEEKAEMLISSGKAKSIEMLHHSQASRPEYSQVKIIPLVSRWCTSNGTDTITLNKGAEALVPANVAAFLIASNEAKGA